MPLIFFRGPSWRIQSHPKHEPAVLSWVGWQGRLMAALKSGCGSHTPLICCLRPGLFFPHSRRWISTPPLPRTLYPLSALRNAQEASSLTLSRAIFLSVLFIPVRPSSIVSATLPASVRREARRLWGPFVPPPLILTVIATLACLAPFGQPR